MIELRRPDVDELGAVSALCLRSKAVWGYSADFLSLCEAALTLSAADLNRDAVAVAVDGLALVGVAQVSRDRSGCYLEKLFVDPACMGRGIGRRLFGWAADTARSLGADHMIVEADPDAVPFYTAMGCKEAGYAPSASVAGRELPRLLHDLTH